MLYFGIKHIYRGQIYLVITSLTSITYKENFTRFWADIVSHDMAIKVMAILVDIITRTIVHVLVQVHGIVGYIQFTQSYTHAQKHKSPGSSDISSGLLRALATKRRASSHCVQKSFFS